MIARFWLPQNRSASLIPNKFRLVDPGRIELPPRQCECRVMPLYYGPLQSPVGVRRIELRLRAPEARVLPVYYTPILAGKLVFTSPNASFLFLKLPLLPTPIAFGGRHRRVFSAP